ncbi:MAG: cupin domain-containing protein [Thaumarchaeota archaeon]|nr:cupin domain-containing protein [Nitrososphaerota archaeon]
MQSDNAVADEFLKAARWADKPASWHEVMPGVKRRILGHSPMGMMALYRIGPQKVFPLHSHPHAQFGVFLEGGGDFEVGGSVWKMVKGDSYYIPPGVPHELKTKEGEVSVVIDFFVPERADYHGEALDPEQE